MAVNLGLTNWTGYWATVVRFKDPNTNKFADLAFKAGAYDMAFRTTYNSPDIDSRPWTYIDHDIPSFYKNYSNLAALITGLSGVNTDGEFLSHIKRLHNVATSGENAKTVLAPVYNSTMSCYIVTITSRVYYVIVENNATVTTSKLNDSADPAALDGFIVDSGNLCAKWKSSVTFYEIKCLY